MKIDKYRYAGGDKFSVKDWDPSDTGPFNNKEDVLDKAEENQTKMADFQEELFAEGKEALLVIFQAMDAAGKDSAIKHVMSGMNPQGIFIHNFKHATQAELLHDYLWRSMRVLPQRGTIGIFNRSYYEDVLISKVHRDDKTNNLPNRCKGDDLFEKRYRQINDFEKYLWENGIRVVKFFLNISKDEQKKRFLERIEDKTKNWKFSTADIKEREYWNDYMRAYEDMVNATASKHMPWYVIPADKKWFAKYMVTEILLKTLEEMDPKYPDLTEERAELLAKCREKLINE